MESNKANIVEAFNQNREAITGAQRQISTDHGYIHSGFGFSYSKSATVNTGAKLLLLFKTGANKHIHLRPTAISSISGAVTLKFKEGGTYVKPAGTPVASEEEDLTFTAFTQPVALSNQNYDGSEITVNSVTGSVDGLLTITTDYTIELLGTDYAVQVVAGGNITTLDQDFTVNYDYTPAANPETLYNRNRQSSIVTTIDGIYTSPTESVAGTVLWSSSVGSGGSVQSRSGGAVQGENDEWVLKQDEDYVLEIDNSSGSNSVVIINLFWYEED